RAQRERGAFVVERLPSLVAPRSWVRRAAVVGVEPVAEEEAPLPGAVEDAAPQPGAPAPHVGAQPPDDAGPTRAAEAPDAESADEASKTTLARATDAAPAADSPPERPAPERR